MKYLLEILYNTLCNINVVRKIYYDISKKKESSLRLLEEDLFMGKEER